MRRHRDAKVTDTLQLSELRRITHNCIMQRWLAGKVANDAIQPISDRLHEGDAPGAVKHDMK